MSGYKHILFATDLGESSVVTSKAAEFAKKFGATLSLVHIVEPIPAYGYPDGMELESPYIEEARAELSKLGKQLNVTDEHQYIEFGSIKTRIIELADELDCDLVIIGSHGRHGLSRLLGSTASAVLHGATCDVLTVRYTEE